jgi:hypothetical protein
MGVLREEDYNLVSRELTLNGVIHNIPSFGKFYVQCSGKN